MKIELILADVGVNVEVHLGARSRHLLPSSCADADHVANAPDVHDNEISSRSLHLATEMRDQGMAARENLRLRAWHTAMAMASSAWSSSLPSCSLTCAPNMRAL